MLYHLFFPLRDLFSPLNVLRYITFRAALAFITAMIINFLIAPAVIKKLKGSQKIQVIREGSPEGHSKKEGTPTMGGLIIIISLLISVLLWARLDNVYVIIVIIGSLWLGLLGFFDDYMKTSKKDTKGIVPAVKLAWQLILGLALASFLYINPPFPSQPYAVAMPFFKDLFINLGQFYICFVIITVIATSNAVNINDGLDGLAIGGFICAAMAYAVLAYISGHAEFSEYLFLPHVPGSGELSIYLTALCGAGLGFLWFNIFPAKVFMGDTGSLFMGGAIGIIALIIKQEALLIIAGGVFLIEIMSVVIQVVSYRWKKKRVFKMAPLHHHFELKGWSEPQVVVRFWIISIVLSLIALSTIKLR